MSDEQPVRASICFVAPMAYPVLANAGSTPIVGGAEVQQSFIATELARRGFDVSMLSMDYGQREGDVVRGVRLLKMHSPDEGVPVLRFVHPRLTRLWSALGRADADVYYQRTSGALTGFVAAFARRRGRRSLFAGAHDADFSTELPLVPNARDRALYRWGVRHADAVIVQTERQRAQCLRVFGRESTLIDSCYRLVERSADHAGVVLWVATAKQHKRPHLFLEVAQRLPQYRFRLIGGAGASAAERSYHDELCRHAATLPNVELCGFIPFAEVERHFDGASVFVNTSVGEGFPNTFLQAWSRGVPTVSFFDAATSLDGRRVGCVVADVESMAAAVHAYKRDTELWRSDGELARRYVRGRHSVASVGDAYERVISRLVQAPSPPRAASGRTSQAA